MSYTPLHYSAAADLEKVAQVLINYGAEIDARSNEGRTPLSVAVSNGKWFITYVIFGHSFWYFLSFIFIQKGHENVTKLLIRAGANINMSDAYGMKAIDF